MTLTTVSTTTNDQGWQGAAFPGSTERHPDEAADAAVELGRLAAGLLADARQRVTLFAGLEHLFGDPAWSILLYLYETFAAQAKATTTDVSMASGAPTTTALRYIGALERAGLVVRTTDEHDRRRSFVTLSAHGRTWMERYLSQVARQATGRPA